MGDVRSTQCMLTNIKNSNSSVAITISLFTGCTKVSDILSKFGQYIVQFFQWQLRVAN